MHQTKGFTLLEIMMVITVIGILSMVAIPSIDEYIKNQRIKAQMYDFLNALNIARSEAVKRKTTTTLCNSTNLTSCAGLSTNWTNGYIVFEDVDGDGLFDAGSDTTINTNAALTGNSSLKKNAASNVTYQTDGSVSAGAVFAICDERGVSEGREITVQPVGRAVLDGGIGTSIASCL